VIVLDGWLMIDTVRFIINVIKKYRNEARCCVFGLTRIPVISQSSRCGWCMTIVAFEELDMVRAMDSPHGPVITTV
jgi:hypothetical protein